jgi:ABC-2 type transport system ATP-binding protein
LEAKDRIGYLPEERGVYKKMRVGDFLLYMARLKGLDGPGLKARVREWLERVGLGETEMKRCDELSKGMQQKVQFIGAVIHHPDLIILDEPFSGLDPVSARQLRQLVMDEHKRGATILFSTHVMANAEQLCDHVVMIHGGQKVMDSGLTAIRNAQGIRGLWFEPLDGKADVQALRNVRGVKRVDREGSAYQITLNDGTDPGAALQEVVAAMPAARIELHRPTLEDIFIEIVGGRGEDIGQLREKLRNGGAVAEVRS